MSFDRTGLKKGDSWLKDIHVRFYRVDKFSFPGLAAGDGGGGGGGGLPLAPGWGAPTTPYLFGAPLEFF